MSIKQINEGIEVACNFYNECSNLNLDKQEYKPYKYLGQTLKHLESHLKNYTEELSREQCKCSEES